jgi:hypothetical protein
LDQIVQRASDPLDMRLVVAEETPEEAGRDGVRDAAEVQHLRHHEKHHQTPVGIK